MADDFVRLKLAGRSNRNSAFGTMCFQRIIPANAQAQRDTRMLAKSELAPMQANYQRSNSAQKKRACFSRLQNIELLARCNRGHLAVKRVRPFKLTQRQRCELPNSGNFSGI